jgi:hypothetical protein
VTPAGRVLAELVPPEGTVTVEPDGIATATLGVDWLVASWEDADGNVTVAAYTLPGGRCLHLWCGPADATHEASATLRAEGLPVRPVPVPPTPWPPPSGVELTGSVGDALDLFSA